MNTTEKAEELMRPADDYACHAYAAQSAAAAKRSPARSTLRAAIEQALREASAVPAEALRLAKVAVDECPAGTPMVCDWMDAAMQACRAMLAAAPAQPAAEPEPVGISVTVKHVYPHFGTADARDGLGTWYGLNTGTAGIALASLKPGMRLVAVVNEWNYVVSAKVEGE